MGSRDKYDRTTSRDIERTPRANLPEEGVHCTGPNQEKDIVGEAGGTEPLHQCTGGHDRQMS
jgi:hypothetical protein